MPCYAAVMAEPNRRYYTPRGKTLAWITRIHRRLYLATDGRLGSRVYAVAEKGHGFLLRPMEILLLTTTGRKTGRARTVPLPYFAYDGRTLLVASFAGGPKHPAWYHNLVANPAVDVQLGRAHHRAHAEVLDADMRDIYWQQLTHDWPRYGVYQETCPRTIPLIDLVW